MKHLNGYTIPAGLITFGIVAFVGYGKLQQQVTTSAKSTDSIGQLQVDVGVLKTEVTHIKDSLAVIRTDQKESRQEQMAAMKAIMRKLEH